MRLRVLSYLLFALLGAASALAAPATAVLDPDSAAIARADSIMRALPPEFGVSESALADPPTAVVGEEFSTAGGKLTDLGTDTVPIIQPFDRFAGYNEWEEREVLYNPDPNRAVWMSALFPGLGQVYNRRYWKLPIIVGGYLGLAYATTWNNGMLSDYTHAYRDIMDTDPATNSYMNFFPPTVTESSIDKTWLTSVLKSRRDFYRRNRDLCIICMVGVYFLAMVDAYVDASLSHFDISPDLSMDWAPALIPDGRNKYPSIGLQWAFNF